jgi:hypothetical protein
MTRKVIVKFKGRWVITYPKLFVPTEWITTVNKSYINR